MYTVIFDEHFAFMIKGLYMSELWEFCGDFIAQLLKDNSSVL